MSTTHIIFQKEEKPFHIFCTFAGMKRNILALYLIKLSKWFTLVMPIIVLFYEKHGLGLQDVFILKSVYSVAAVALEIPSGYLADVYPFLSRIPVLFVHFNIHSFPFRRNLVRHRANTGERCRFRSIIRHYRPIPKREFILTI